MDDRDEIIHDRVGNRFVENSLVAEALQIHLEALQLDTKLVRNVRKGETTEVGLSGARAQRRKLGRGYLDFVIPRRIRVFK